MRVSFSTMTPYEAELLDDVHTTLTELDLWGWLAAYQPYPGGDFIFDVGPEIDRIKAGLTHKELSRTTFAWMMRRMYERVSKKS